MTTPNRATPAALRLKLLTPRGLSSRAVDAIGALVSRLRASEYVRLGGGRRFRAGQRHRTATAARIGLLVIATAVAFDALALQSLDVRVTRVALALDLVVFGVSLAGCWLLGGRLRRHPELVAWSGMIGLTLSSVTSGTAVPSLVVQTLGYLLVIPGLVALILPWRTRTHVLWLVAYGIIGYAYLAFADMGRFSDSERADILVVFGVALGASLAGHVLLHRAQIRNFAQLARIGSLRRKTGHDMVELERLHRALELTARTDPLTGAGNRRRLDEDLRVVRAQITRSGFTYGIAEIDLDHFKGINDEYGHAVGDDVLRRVAQVIGGSLRAGDAVYRLGGEEFLVVLRTPDFEALGAVAERLRLVVLGLGIEHPGNLPHKVVSVSIGAAFIGAGEAEETDEAWIARADAGLYEAKRRGRNRIFLQAA